MSQLNWSQYCSYFLPSLVHKLSHLNPDIEMRVFYISHIFRHLLVLDYYALLVPGLDLLIRFFWILCLWVQVKPGILPSCLLIVILNNTTDVVWFYSCIIIHVDVVNLFSSKIRSRLSYTQLWESHNICIIHVATSRFPIQRLLALHISSRNSYSSRKCQGLPRHTIMCNSLSSTWKSRSDSGELWKGGAPFLGALEGGAPFCIPSVFSQQSTVVLRYENEVNQYDTIIFFLANFSKFYPI